MVTDGGDDVARENAHRDMRMTDSGKAVGVTQATGQPVASWRSLFGNAEGHDEDLKLSYHKPAVLNDEVVAVCSQPITD